MHLHNSSFLRPSPISSLSCRQLSESRWDVEELLLGHSFLPQRGVHALLRRLRHQAVCSWWTALFGSAWELRRPVELASVSSIALSLHPQPSPPSSSLLTSVFGIPLAHLCFALTWTQEHDLAPHSITALNIVIVYVKVCVHSPFLLQLFLCSFHLSYSVVVLVFLWKCKNN